MGMPKGLARATAYYSTLAAWADWRKLAAEVTAAGHADLVAQYQPSEGAGWRKVDAEPKARTASARLKAAFAARQLPERV